MNLRAIQGKILALLKEYRFREVRDGFVRKFFARSIGLEWWLTRRGLQILNELARMTVAANPHLPLKVDPTAAVIEKVLQDHADDGALFISFAFHRANTLLDISALPERQLAKAVWLLIKQALEASVTEWLVVVACHRLQSRSVDVGFDGLFLLERTDISSWRQISGDFDNADHWDPQTGVVTETDPKIFGQRLPETWATCRAEGTALGANSVARDRFRMLIALLFALEYPVKPELLTKSMLDPPTWSTQFASKSGNTEYTHIYSHIGALVPQTFADVNVSDVLLSRVREWYGRREKSVAELRRRAAVASQFLHYGFVADDLEQFIHFFTSVDALFGVRGRVESTVVAGVEQVFGDSSWGERASRLFDLRSELVHGGSSSIEGWPWYEEYRRHFKSEPLRDMAVIATTALRSFFG